MDEDQEKVLDDAKKNVKESSYYLRKAIDEANLREALRSANQMLQELRSTQLSPKNYQYIFMLIFDEMRNLETFIKEEYRRGRKMNNLYESVQYALNIIPRIYLLITVGSVYIQTHEIGATEILTDLLDLVKGVQLPQHGLFIRYYFLKMCKDRLPDKGSEFEGPNNDINNAINTIMQNLSEMNKLWIRMSMGNKEKSRREKERIDLKILVGENVHRLSSLEGVDLDVYKEKVLPQLIEIITSSKDMISQQYLLECIIQVFPDEFHLDTLSIILDVCTTKVDVKVDKKLVFIKLMDRLAEYACGQDNQLQQLTTSIDIYGLFKQNIDTMIQNFNSTEFKSVLDLQVTFLKFTLRCYKENTDYINQILKSSVQICEKQDQSDFDDDCQKCIVKFLTVPLETMALSILTMDEYPNLMKYLPFPKRRQVASKIVQAVVQLKSRIENIEITQQYLKFITPLLKTEVDYVEIDEQEFAEEQSLVARSIHLVDNDNPKINWQILSLFIEKFKEGESKRQKFTIPASVFALFKIARQIREQNISGVNYETLFDVIKELIALVHQNYPDMALKLYLQLAFLINEIDEEKKYDEYCYEVASQALQIYQDDLGDSDQKMKALQQIIGTLNMLSCMSEDNYDGLCTNATQFSSKLLKKSDQCLEVLKCSHLFYNNTIQNDATMAACIKKSIKLAGVCMKQSIKNVSLYIHILNKIFLFISTSEIKVEDAQDCINNIKENLEKIKGENDIEVELAVHYWKNTVEYMESKVQKQEKGFVELKF